ncbi:hypothetical protein ACHAO5_007686 [Verticillium nonalfalfae]
MDPQPWSFTQTMPTMPAPLAAVPSLLACLRGITQTHRSVKTTLSASPPQHAANAARAAVTSRANLSWTASGEAPRGSRST